MIEKISTLTQTLTQIVYGNSFGAWLTACGAALVFYITTRSLLEFIGRRLHRSQHAEKYGFTRFLCVLIDSTSRLFILMLSLFLGSWFLELTPKASNMLGILSSMAFFLQLGYWGKSLIDYKFQRMLDDKTDIAERQHLQTLVIPLKFVVIGILWTILILAALDNVGVNVTALVTGLGIGGVAVALAVQSTLADLLAALTIAFDKPFIVGDFVIVGDEKGTVEKIGVKSTRVRSLDGEEIIFPNQDLLKARIRNFKRMNERRVLFSFGVVYETPLEKLQQVTEFVKEIIHGLPNTRLDRAHFSKLGSSAYEFEVVYFVLSGDYNLYMDYQQSINFALIEKLNAQGIPFASPIQTLYVTNAKSHPG